MKRLGVEVNNLFGKNIIYKKSYSPNNETVFSPDKKITKDNIFSLVVDALTKMPKKEIVPKGVVKKVVSLEEMIDSLTTRIKKNIKMSFGDFSKKGKNDRINVVISFLAMLELVKQGALMVKQTRDFGDIDMESLDTGVPHY